MIHAPIFAFDFSMNKPAMACLVDNKLSIYFWPLSCDSKTYDALASHGIVVIDRKLKSIKEKEMDESQLILTHVERASNLAETIVTTIKDILKLYNYNMKDVIIANEGFAFAAKGDAALDLSGYKYILMKALIDAGAKIFKTYSPITIKSTAGCAKKGMGKDDMISAMGNFNLSDIHPFINAIKNENADLRKHTNYVPGVDDIADAFWCLNTIVKKENIECILNEQN